MTAPTTIFGSPSGEPNGTTNRPTIQQMCEKVWTQPLEVACRTELLKIPDDLWPFHADVKFMLKIHELLYDKTEVVFCRSGCGRKTRQSKDDRRFGSTPPLSDGYIA
jgi:hypothetical protein